MIIKKDVFYASCKPCTTPFRVKNYFFWVGLLKRILMIPENRPIYVADDLINEEAQIAVLIRK
jgi:hypothetical protein